MFGALAAAAGQPGIIKSIQEVEITIAAGSASQTAAISAVRKDKTVLIWNGVRSAETTNLNKEDEVRIELTTGVLITAQTNAANASNSRIVRCTVIEFEPSIVKNVQHLTGTLTNVSNVDVTISSVNTAYSAVFYLGASCNLNDGNQNYARLVATLTGSTTVNLNCGSAGTFVTIGSFCVVEFYSNVIQSIQAAVNTIAPGSATQNTTISAVTEANCMLAWGGNRIDNTFFNTVAGVTEGYIYLAGTTTLTQTRLSTTGLYASITAVTVIEFKTGILKSRQIGHTDIPTSSSSADDTVTTVVKARSITNYLGQSITSSTAGTSDNSIVRASVSLNSSTINRKSRSGSSATYGLKISWEVLEFYEYPKL